MQTERVALTCTLAHVWIRWLAGSSCVTGSSDQCWWLLGAMGWAGSLTREGTSCVSEHCLVSHCLGPGGLQPPRLLCPRNSPGKSTGVGCHFLLQGIFPTQGLNSGLLHWRQILYHLSHQGSPGKGYMLQIADSLCCTAGSNSTL